MSPDRQLPSPDPLPASFTAWLRQTPPAQSDDFSQRLHRRIEQSFSDPDFLVDLLLEADSHPRFHDPEFLQRVRARIRRSERPRPLRTLVTFFAPLAAAAAIALAVTAPFYQQAPTAAAKGSVAQLPGPEATLHDGPAPTLHADVARIFALAANLPSDTDLSRLPADTALSLLTQ